MCTPSATQHIKWNGSCDNTFWDDIIDGAFKKKKKTIKRN